MEKKSKSNRRDFFKKSALGVLGTITIPAFMGSHSNPIKNQGFRVALLKAVPERWNMAANMDLFAEHVHIAHLAGAQLFITCECFLDGYNCSTLPDRDEFYEKQTIAPDHEYITRVREIAGKYGMHLVFGYSKRDGEEKQIRNAALFVDGNGDKIGEFYKLDCPRTDHDRIFTQGEELPVFETRFGRLGILICRDRRLRENYVTLKEKDAQGVLIPSYGFWGEKNDAILTDFAVEFGLWILFSHPNQSLIIAPDGTIQARYEGNVPDILLYDVVF